MKGCGLGVALFNIVSLGFLQGTCMAPWGDLRPLTCRLSEVGGPVSSFHFPVLPELKREGACSTSFQGGGGVRVSREVWGCPWGVTFPQGQGGRRPQAAPASAHPGGPRTELRQDLSHGVYAAFMLQNFDSKSNL